MNIVKKHNRFHSSPFHRLFILVIRYSPRMRRVRGGGGIEDKRGVFFHLFFRVVFRACESVKMCF